MKSFLVLFIFFSYNLFSQSVSTNDKYQKRINDLRLKYGEQLEYKYIVGNRYDSGDLCLKGNCKNGYGTLISGNKKFICNFKDGKPYGTGLIVFMSDYKHLAVIEGEFDGWNMESGTLYLDGYCETKFSEPYTRSSSKFIEKPLVYEGPIKILNGSTTNYDIRYYDLMINMNTFDNENKPQIVNFNGLCIDLTETEQTYASLLEYFGMTVFNTNQYSDIKFMDENDLPLSKNFILSENPKIINVYEVEKGWNTKKQTKVAQVKIWRKTVTSDRGYKYWFDYELLQLYQNFDESYDFLKLDKITRVDDNFRFGEISINMSKVGEEKVPYTKTISNDEFIENKLVGTDASGNKIFEPVYKRNEEVVSGNITYNLLKLDCFCDGQFITTLQAKQESLPLTNLTNGLTPFYINDKKFINIDDAIKTTYKKLIHKTCTYKKK